MKVELLKQIFDGYIGFKILSLTDCCKKIRDCPVIDVFVDDVDRPIVAIEETRHIHDWDDEYNLTYLYEIKRCPFCGKKIEVSVIKEEDVTDKYFSLKKKRNELWTSIIIQILCKKEMNFIKKLLIWTTKSIGIIRCACMMLN